MYFQIVIVSLTIFLANCRVNYIPDRVLIDKHCGPHAVLCDHVEDYPSHLVHTAAARPGYVVELLRKSNFVPYVEIQNRKLGITTGDVSNGDNELCSTKIHYMTPTMGVTKDDTWVYLYNNGEFALEGRECENPGGNCEIVLDGYRMICVQKYVYTVLPTIADLGDIVNKEIKIPGGCVCKYQNQ